MKVIIMRGCSGSGKSTYVEKIKEEYGEDRVSVCSADDIRVEKHGSYVFKPEENALVHQECFSLFHYICDTVALQEDPDYLICNPYLDVCVVDNTNTQLHEISPYLKIAQLY